MQDMTVEAGVSPAGRTAASTGRILIAVVAARALEE